MQKLQTSNLYECLLTLRCNYQSMPDKILNIVQESQKVVNDYAKDYSVWALSILGATLLLILSTDYLRPDQKKFKLIYILFLPAWILLCFVLYEYTLLKNHLFILNTAKTNEEIIKACIYINNHYSSQSSYFLYSIFILGFWVFAYLIWWIFYNNQKNKK